MPHDGKIARTAPRASEYTAPAPAAATTRLAGVALPTGVRLHYAERGDPAGDGVVMLHGLSDSWRSFERVLSLLPERLRVVAPDQRGHGDSERPAGGYALAGLAADVLALMDALGLERATVVGHSMGSFVAQQVALLAPERVSGLVLVASATSVRRFDGIAELVHIVGELDEPEAPVPEEFARAFQESTIHAPVPAAFMDGAVAASLKLPGRVWRALLDGMLAAGEPAALARHRIPTLLLWGDRDLYATRAEQRALLAMLPTARLAVFPETGHAPHWERPAEFARVVGGFVGG